jgi:hypothetical protein
MKKLWLNFLKLDKYLDTKIIPLLLILFIVLIKLPNFFEPHHQVDESIYLTIGQGLREGKTLYKDIFDHKPPLIYWLSFFTKDLIQFKILGLFFSLTSAFYFYRISQKLFKSNFLVTFSNLLFIFLSFTPIFEGNSVNGELIFITFNLIAINLFLEQKKDYSFLVGLFFSLAILTKISAFSGILTAFLFIILTFSKKKKISYLKKGLTGFIFPIVITLIWSLWQGNLLETYQSVFIYNLLYVRYDLLKIAFPLSVLLSLPVKIIANFLLTFIVYKNYKRNKINKKQLLIFILFINQLFFALLSNRDYKHYFLQIIPSLSFLITDLFRLLKKKKLNLIKNHLLLLITLALVFKIVDPFKNKRFELGNYYQNFYNLIVKKISPTEYANNFNYLVLDNYYLANFFSGKENKTIYLWGDNPSVFSTIKRIPSNKFLTNFHRFDHLSNQEISNDLIINQPDYLILINSDKKSLENILIFKNYFYPILFLDHSTIYKKY